MPQIEDVPRMILERLLQVADSLEQILLGSKQGLRGEIALQGTTISKDPDRLLRRNHFIQSNRLDSDLIDHAGDLFKVAASTANEENSRNTTTVESFEDSAAIMERELIERLVGEHSSPGIEKLHGVGPRGDLSLEVFGDRIGNLFHQDMHIRRRFIEHPLGSGSHTRQPLWAIRL